MHDLRPRAASSSTSSSAVSSATPYVFAPSGSFDGADGAWSTFIINVGADGNGTNGQDFKVQIATSGSLTAIPFQADWCNEPDADECAADRGILLYDAQQELGFQTDVSNSWKEIGVYSYEPELDYVPTIRPNSTYGTDTVGLGRASNESLMLAGQLVVSLTTEDFPMGMFGLSVSPVSLGSNARLTWLETFFDAEQIPSLSYGYTAGAKYRNKEVTGNLVFGGYDRSRFDAGTSGSFSMSGSGNHSLELAVQSITITPDPDVEINEYSLTSDSGGFTARIDSTFPYLWLPDAVCAGFADHFHLAYDSDTDLYLINASAHAQNLRTNATVTFALGDDPTGGDPTTSLLFPYEAFYQSATFPLTNTTNSTPYFPIKRSPTGIYILGRAFLQETYLTVDYNRSNFSLAQATFPTPSPAPQVIAIHPPSAFIPVNSTSDDPEHSYKLSARDIIGIAIGVAAFIFLLLSLLALFLYRRHRRRHAHNQYLAAAVRTNHAKSAADIDTLAAANGAIRPRRISELDSEPCTNNGGGGGRASSSYLSTTTSNPASPGAGSGSLTLGPHRYSAGSNSTYNGVNGGGGAGGFYTPVEVDGSDKSPSPRSAIMCVIPEMESPSPAVAIAPPQPAELESPPLVVGGRREQQQRGRRRSGGGGGGAGAGAMGLGMGTRRGLADVHELPGESVGVVGGEGVEGNGQRVERQSAGAATSASEESEASEKTVVADEDAGAGAVRRRGGDDGVGAGGGKEEGEEEKEMN